MTFIPILLFTIPMPLWPGGRRCEFLPFLVG